MCEQWACDQEKAEERGTKRGRRSALDSPDEEDQDDEPRSDSDDDDADERPSKRRQLLDEDEFPWVKHEALVPLRPDLAETVRLLGIYAVDPKRSLRSLLSRTRVEFPESQWLRLLTNKAVDLDAVLTAFYSVAPSSGHTETVGEVDLTFHGSSKATRFVSSQSEWTLAWMQTVQAALTVFPHLADQFREWGLYILGKFSAVHDSQHHRVISFEKAGRLLASRRSDVGLDQLFHFTALETMHLNSMGRLAVDKSRSNGSAQKPRTTSGKSTEPCRLWNEGRCRREPADCRNLHICAGCRKNHPQSECTK
ncbi:hypothetical protein C8R43DRAFT_879502 [Mycena crocata]|nr:hypothetical protein C8R43DRAFT_879502 [Mycena crocata]